MVTTTIYGRAHAQNTGSSFCVVHNYRGRPCEGLLFHSDGSAPILTGSRDEIEAVLFRAGYTKIVDSNWLQPKKD